MTINQLVSSHIHFEKLFAARQPPDDTIQETLRVEDVKSPNIRIARTLAVCSFGLLRFLSMKSLYRVRLHLDEEGASAEEIVEQFDTLSLADVHLVLGYYLRHQDEIRAHLADEDR